MTPKEKALELYQKHLRYTPGDYEEDYYTKKACLITVDEILESSPSLPILSDCGTFGGDIELSKQYWQEVKEEIEKL